jgi:ABC-2 type transport system ATP-binding protein
VFVSSHQLAEVQQIADRVAILSNGRAVAAGSVADVLAQGRPRGLLVRLPDLRAGLDALRAAKIEATLDGDALRVALPPEDAARVTQTLARKKLYLTELRPQEISLETVFLELTEPPR